MKMKCFFGFHTWSKWKTIEGTVKCNDPGLWYWHWSETRACSCCHATQQREV